MINTRKQLTLFKQQALELYNNEGPYKTVMIVPTGSSIGLTCVCKEGVNFHFLVKEWTSPDCFGTLYSESISEEKVLLILFGMNLEVVSDHFRLRENP